MCSKMHTCVTYDKCIKWVAMLWVPVYCKQQMVSITAWSQHIWVHRQWDPTTYMWVCQHIPNKCKAVVVQIIGSWLLVSHSEGLGSILGMSTWTQSAVSGTDMGFSQITLVFPMSFSFHAPHAYFTHLQPCCYTILATENTIKQTHTHTSLTSPELWPYFTATRKQVALAWCLT